MHFSFSATYELTITNWHCHGSIVRHLDYTSARLRRAVKVSSLLPTRFTDLKTEKNGGFRADPLAKYHRFLFFGILFKDFRTFLYAKMRHVPFVPALSHPQLSLYEPTLSFSFLFFLSIVFNIPFPI